MSLKLKDAKSGGDFVRPEPGTHPARCYAVIDLGTHTETTQFGIKTNRKIQISWELPEETHVFDEKKGPQPFSVHKRYNFTMGAKATLQVDLESWRAKKFTPEDIENFEIKKLVGKPCVLSLQESESNGKTYTNVKSVSPPMKGQAVKPGVNKQVYYDVTMGQNDVFDSIPEFLQKYIATCEEWSGSPDDDGKSDDNFLGGIDKEENSTAATPKDDDLPF